MRNAITHSSIAIYGPPKIGKTLDVISAFNKAFVCLADPGGLVTVQSHLGFLPAHAELTNLTDPYGEIMRVIDQQFIPGLQQKKYSAIVIDTVTELADRILMAEDVFTKNDPRRSYPRTAGKIKAIMRKCMMLNTWFVGIFHEIEPTIEETRVIKGSLALPGGKLQVAVAGMFNSVLRAVYQSERMYICNPADHSYITGDRTGACKSRQEMDLRPILWRMVRPGETEPEFPPKVETTEEKGIVL